MKITRLTPTTPTLISEAKINSPHLAGQSTAQLLDLLNRKQTHQSRANDRDSTAVWRAMGYAYDAGVHVVPLFTEAADLKEYLKLVGAVNSTEQSRARAFYLAPKEYYVEYTNIKYGDGWNDATKFLAGRKKLIVGVKAELAKYGLDEEDFQEYADYLEREDLRNAGGSTQLKSQITRLTKKHNEEQMAAKTAQQAGAPATNLPPPPRDVPAMKGNLLPNPYYMGTNQYNGPIVNTQWQTGAMKNLMTTFILAADLLGEPLGNINYSADPVAGIDYFYAKSKNGVFVFYVNGNDGKNMKVMVNGSTYRLRSVVIANKPRDTAKHIARYYWQTAPNIP